MALKWSPSLLQDKEENTNKKKYNKTKQKKKRKKKRKPQNYWLNSDSSFFIKPDWKVCRVGNLRGDDWRFMLTAG